MTLGKPTPDSAGDETTTFLVPTTAAVTTTATATPQTSAPSEAVSTTRPFPDPPPAPNSICAQLVLDIEASQLDVELSGTAVAGIRTTQGDGCEVTYFFPHPSTDQSVIAITRAKRTLNNRACCDPTLDDDETAQEISGGSTIYRDPTGLDSNVSPGSGRVTVIRPDRFVIAVSAYGGGLTIEQLEVIALRLHAASPSPQ